MLGATNDFFGYSVALSSDGTVALVGAPGKTINGISSRGAAFVFTRSGPTASLVLSQTLLNSINDDSASSFGEAVALSADGNTALVGAPDQMVGSTFRQGATFAFTRTNTTAQFGAAQSLVESSGGSPTDHFGAAVALSSDGNTALIAVPGKEASYVFTRASASSAYAQSQVLTSTVGSGLGISVALDGNGNIALVGGVENAVAFTRTNTGANYAIAQTITTTGSTGFGSAVALDGAGATAFVGASGSNQAFVFTSTAVISNPYAQSQVLTGTNGFGNAIAVSADSMTVIVGAEASNSVYLHNGSNGLYAQSAIQTEGDASTYGNSVAVSADGISVLVGAPDSTVSTNPNQGAVYVYRQTITPSSLVVTSSPNPSNVGQTVTITATITPASATGTVTFTTATATIGTATVVSGTAVITTNTLPNGSTVITATYSGSANLGPSLGTTTQVVNCTSLTVTSTADNGSCGSLRTSLLQAAASQAPTQTITISLTAGSVISLTTGVTIPKGVKLTTQPAANCGTNPPVILQGTGASSGVGVTLGGNNNLYGLWIRGFSGTQLVAPPGHGGNVLQCVKASKS